MAVLTPTPISRDGIDPAALATPADAAGDEWTNNGRQVLLVQNRGQGDAVVSMVLPVEMDGQTVPPREAVVPAGTWRIIGPFPISYYSSTCRVSVTPAADARVALIEAPRTQ